MIYEIEKLLNVTLLNELVDAMLNGLSYQYELDGLKIDAKSGDGWKTLTMSYETPNEKEIAEKERLAFQERLDSIEDDLFEEVCAEIGSDELARLSNCLNSGCLESVRAAITKFEQTYKLVINHKIEHLKALL